MCRSGLVVRNNQLNDGQYLDQSHIGYAGTISGDAHPFSGAPGPLGKDDIGFSFGGGANTGGQIANGVGAGDEFREHPLCAGFWLCQPADQCAVEHDQLCDPESL